ncbi:MAG TPA: Gfo/Idh/MocA family oxidoreductase [Xanthobacteraceae bacterium]
MIRIAFLGSDSTHTEAFAQLINLPGAPFAGVAKVVAIQGLDPEQARHKAAENGIGLAAATVAEALDGIDLAMVIGRFADSHLEPALAAIERGIPTFVDKPFTDTSAHAGVLIARARERQVALCSSSPLRFAAEIAALSASQPATFLASAPAVCTDLGPDPRLNSAFFYGIHALEMLLELAGHDIETKQITYGRRFINVHLDMKSGNAAQLQLVRGTPEFYSIGRIDSTGQKLANVALDGSYYRAELRYILGEFLPGKRSIPLESSAAAVALLEEIDANDRFRT